MGRKRRARGRPVNGVLLLDKPAGMTSNQVLQHCKRLFQAAKAGHTGSLDKLATGLLPLCFGEATKLSGFLLESSKRYLAECRLGISTSTGDAAGEKIATAVVPDLSDREIEKALERFRGEISQVPPMHSALKKDGMRLYKLAYQGIEVEREPRQVMIHDLHLLERTADTLLLDVSCSKGTYIRTLAEDIGSAIGCGAHVQSLRRTEAGPFKLDAAVTVEMLEEHADTGPEALDAYLLPMDHILEDVPALSLNESLAFYMRQGQAVIVPRAPADGLVRIYDPGSHFMGIGEILDDGRVSPKRLVRAGKQA